MPNSDKTTIKMRAFPGDAGAEPAKPAVNQNAADELTRKNAQIDDLKKKLLEHLNTIEQLQQNLRQEQGKSPELVRKVATLEARIKELSALEEQVKKIPVLENRIRELTEALNRIATIAASGKAS